ncbi:hypothetical protein, partial [Staphylococcus aureus]|uniref:hypothetical protein n=1 Tax=Staphylococcus aureus TaxID=1280 RepID=UPI00210E53FC
FFRRCPPPPTPKQGVPLSPSTPPSRFVRQLFKKKNKGVSKPPKKIKKKRKKKPKKLMIKKHQIW